MSARRQRWRGVIPPLSFRPRTLGWRATCERGRLLETSMHFLTPIRLLAALVVPFATAAQAIEFIEIGHPGNPADANGFGSVPHVYRIGKYEVLLEEYAVFLNAVARTDAYALWSPNMETVESVAGIARTGSPGNFSYTVLGDGRRPVTWVNWFDAARFANWLHHGQPTTGVQDATTTEDGAYALNGTSNGLVVKRPTARFWIPSENEWYKVAYYDPSPSGPADDYWLYPTRSDTPPGNLLGATPNQANYNDGDFSVTQSAAFSPSQNYLTTAGAFSASPGPFGTFDVGGNVWEWNDALLNDSRGLRGGTWDRAVDTLSTTYRGAHLPQDAYEQVGFRIAAAPVPPVDPIAPTVDGFLLKFIGVPGAWYVVQYNDTLTGAWQTFTPPGPIQAGPQGVFAYEDRPVPRPAARFYRAIPAP
jgi:formylglycine-generating enzyme